MSSLQAPQLSVSASQARANDDNRRVPSWAVFLIGALLLVALLPPLLKPAEFMQDDAYFYLQIAHNITTGQGSTFHGITPTNGYHPLWLWMVTAVTMMADGDKTISLYLVFLLQGLLVAASFLVLKRLTNAMGLGHWLIALAVLAAYLLGTGVYGSEAHVNALCLLISLWALWTALRARSPAHWLLAGFAFGIAILARLDNVFVVFALVTLAVLSDAKQGIRRAIVTTAALAIGGSVVMLPYLGYNLTHYGHLVPISGAIKSTFPNFAPDLNNLGSMGKLASPFGLLALVVGLFLDGNAERRIVWMGLGMGTLLHAAYIVCFTDHYTFWAWYYVLAVITAALTASYLFGWFACRVASPLPHRMIARATILAASLVLTAGSARAWLKAYPIHEIGPFRINVEINKYRWPDEFAGWMKDNLAPGTKVFVYDWPGAIAYYSDLPLLPMDGLVNDFQYNDDLVRLGIKQYLCLHDVKYFFGLIEPWQTDVEVTVSAPLYRIPVGTLQLSEEDILVRTDDVLSRPKEALPFAIWRLHCPPEPEPIKD